VHITTAATSVPGAPFTWFSNNSTDPVELEVLLYVAELSERFMGAQNKGWGCGSSNGEALSRYFAERETPPGTIPQWGVTGPSWASRLSRLDQ
jgi:hypothetical protein